MPVIDLVAAKAPAKRWAPAGRRAPGGRVRRFLASWAARGAEAWRQVRLRRQTRRYVMTMDERTLSDIGVSRAQALFEIDNGCRHGN